MNVRTETTAAAERSGLKRWGVSLGYASVSAIVGGATLPFGALPFGFALLCSAGRHTLAVFLGCCVSALRFQDPPPLIAAYAVCLLARIAFSFGEKQSDSRLCAFGGCFFGEHVSLKTVSASIGAFAISLYKLLGSGFLYYDLFGALICIFSAAALAPLWSAVESSLKSDSPSAIQSLSVISLCAAAIWGLRGVSVYGISAPAFACMLIALTTCRRRGLITGAFVALVGGLCVSLSYAPLFVFGTVCYGFIGALSPLLGCFSSFAVGVAWGIYIDGIASVSALLPALIASNFLFFIIDKLFFADEKSDADGAVGDGESDKTVKMTDGVARVRLDDAACRIKLLCEGFSSLSDALLRISERSGISRAWQNESDAFCACYADDGLYAEIGELCGEDAQIPLEHDSLSKDARAVSLASDLGAISDYLAGIMVENALDFSFNEALSKRVAAELERELPTQTFCAQVIGEGNKRVIVSSDDPLALSQHSRRICAAAGRVCGFPLRATEVREGEGSAYVTLCRASVLTASVFGQKKGCREYGSLCGDSFGTIRGEGDGQLFAFISDGMGSGAAAAKASGLCSLFLQKLLPVNMSAGNTVSATLTALNAFLRAENGIGSNECSATVDLAHLDLVNCRALFYKCGAAPTYVLRDGSLFKIHAKTLPAGIVSELDVGKISLDLVPGDVIVMVSDGITEGKEECPELFELLRSRLLTHSSEQLACAVIDYAEQRGCEDDASVVVVRISERPLSSFATD